MKKIIFATIISLSLNFVKAQPELWSVAVTGGDDFGVLYSMTPGNTFFNQQYNHTGNPGENPRGSLVEAPNGKFYGMTYLGGFFTSGSGVLFEYDPSTGVYTILKNFFLQTGNQPFGTLVVGPSGNLYGVTTVNGTSSGGTLFEYNIPTNSLNILHNFSMPGGGFSMGSPMFASNGKIYGLTRGGGATSNGVLYEYDLTTSTYTKKHDFTTTTGTMPFGHLIQASNGKLYGMTEYGGLSNLGTLEFISIKFIMKICVLVSSCAMHKQLTLLYLHV